MEYLLLGPVSATVNGRPVDLGRRRERCLLALLLLQVGRPVSMDRLIELLWDGELPHEPRAAVHVHVSRLRRRLALAGTPAGVARLVSGAAGYSFETDPESVDVHRFTTMVERARRMTDSAERSALLRAALALWRGPALADTASERLRSRVCAGLDETRLAALELRVEADLRLGRHAELVSELADLTVRHPTREGLVAAQMLALYRCGRQSDALGAYQRLTGELAEELGLDPGPALRDLHTAVLRNDPDLLGAPQPAPDPRPAATVPHRPAQLPADLATFTGRAGELAHLTDLVAGNEPGAVVIGAIDGMAGVGKTALAVHAAHRLAPRFPDGQLFLDLHGFTQGLEPVDPADALDRMLRSLGVPAEQIPDDPEDRAARYRGELAGRRMLVVLDSACSEEQVRPLLPAAPGCLVLITSRQRLTGLDDARAISLDVMPPPDAAELFTRVAGTCPTSRDPELAEIVDLCGRLPLAVRIAAARLRARPNWAPRRLLDLLADERHRLAELAAGQRSVAAAFGVSYDHLTPDQRRMFRLLGLHLGPDIDGHAAAALAGLTPQHACTLLEGLVDAHLLQARGQDRYAMHDLVRAFAADRAERDEPAAERRAALHRAQDYWLAVAGTALDRLGPSRLPVGEPRHRPADPPPIGSSEQALAWLDAEFGNLRAAAGQAARAGFPDHAWMLPYTLWHYLYQRGHIQESLPMYREALAATERSGDDRGRAAILHNLGSLHWRLGRPTDALDHHTRALALFEDLGDPLGQAHVLGNLALVHMTLGAHDRALDVHERTLTLHERLGDRSGLARTLGNIGLVHTRLGEHALALEYHEKSAALFEELGDRVGLARSLGNMGLAHEEGGELQQARDRYERAIDLLVTLGDRLTEARTRSNLAGILARLGAHGDALEIHEATVGISDGLDDPGLRAELLNAFGESCRHAGQARRAVDLHGSALMLAAGTGDRYEEARAHDGAGTAQYHLGRHDEAGAHWQAALRLATELGLLGEVGQLRDKLRSVDPAAVP